MNYLSLYRSFRPRQFTEMVGQQSVVTALKNQSKSGRIAHAYLFCGSRGTGKTSAARIMAMAINCKNPQEGDPCLLCENCLALSNESTLDVFEMDAASNSRVEEIREMLSKTDYPPQFVKYKVYIIDEVHMLSNAAFNALLKTLEEPPEYMVFILATTEPQKLPATILSRCQRFDFGRITEKEIVSRLRLALKDGITAEEGALQLIAASAEGSMRDAWSLMDMCLGVTTHLSEESVREAMGAMSQEFLFDFLDALRGYDSAKALALVDELMRKGRDVQVFLRDFAAHLRQVIAVKWTGQGIRETTRDNLLRLRQQADSTQASALLRMLESCMLAETESRWSSSPRAVLEVYALKVCQVEQAQDVDGLLDRLLQLEAQVASLRSGQGSTPNAVESDHQAKVSHSSVSPTDAKTSAVRSPLSTQEEPQAQAKKEASAPVALSSEKPIISAQPSPAALSKEPPAVIATEIKDAESVPAATNRGETPTADKANPHAVPANDGAISTGDEPAASLDVPADVKVNTAAGKTNAQEDALEIPSQEQGEAAAPATRDERISPSPSPLPLSQPAPKKPATTPKDAWNNMLTQLKRQNQGLYSMVSRGKYGGYENEVFTLLFSKEDDIMTTIINQPDRANLMEGLLSEQMGLPVRFEARGPNGIGRLPLKTEEKVDEHLEALSQVFGRDKVIVKNP